MNVLISFLALCFMIVIHEAGHCVMAKLVGVHVIEFSVGFGKSLYSRKFGNTVYSIKPLPFGGACRVLGELDIDNLDIDDNEAIEEYRRIEEEFKGHSLQDVNRFKRLLIMIAGPGMNLVFGAILFGVYGFIMSGYSWSFYTVIKYSVLMTYEMIIVILQSLSMLFMGGLTINDFAGPIGTVAVMSKSVADIANFVSINGILSVSLGVMNLLPLPMLDGGHAFYLIFAAITRKEVSKRLKISITVAFVIMLVGFSAVIAVYDVIRIAGGQL